MPFGKGSAFYFEITQKVKHPAAGCAIIEPQQGTECGAQHPNPCGKEADTVRDFYIFAESLCYIEEMLCEELDQAEIARHCGCSVSALQKTWKYCTKLGVMQYVRRRRLTLAAREISQGAPVLDTAVKYGYGSNEAFTRAFRLFWGISPSDFAKTRSFTGLYPRMHLNEPNGGIMMRVRFDLTELYEQLQNRTGTYIVCFDIRNLMVINEKSRELGDEVIRSSAERIDRALKDGMFAFRVGGDEFAVVTGCTDIADARAFEQSVTAQNTDTVTLNGMTAPVYLHSGIMQYNGACTDFYEDFEHSVVRE